MFSSFSAGGSSFRLASRSILRSSKSLFSEPLLQQQQKSVAMVSRGRSDLASRFSFASKTKKINNNNNNNVFFSTSGKESAKSGETTAAAAAKTAEKTASSAPKSSDVGWWKSAEFWGWAGSIAAWGMSGAAIYDSALQGPEVISLTMTPVLMVYSGLFARWAWVVKPRNLSLMYCHIANIIAQTNQLRRALEYKVENGEEEKVKEMMQQVGMLGGITAAAIVGGPTARTALSGANLGFVSKFAAADAGPFTVHFWAPMSKVFISGASMLDLNRPTDKISLPQYAALTATGFFFTRYALLVTPINYILSSVNVALFLSSFWHFGRKVKADFIDGDDQ
mmetsp:Transcript_7319/g.15039  ORF Transcript_7319/g.15039 Transcript_7319/m.15039 type:complete len:337 (+) Transcript_7319:165-1175(+)